jgi:hypothetical protein
MSAAHESEKPARVFIVARREPELYEYLSARFAGEADVTVVLDRRLAARRRRALPAAAERRRAERRSRSDVDEQLQTTSLAIVTPSDAQPTGEARQWIEMMQRGVAAIRGALDERDRLQRASLAIGQENEWLRSQMDRSWKELADVDVTIARAIAIVNDLRTRLRGEPRPEGTP